MWAESNDSGLLNQFTTTESQHASRNQPQRRDVADSQQMKQKKAVQDPFLDAMQQAEDAEARCLIGPPEECSPKIVGAHWLQEAKLKRIASKDGKVLIMTVDSRKRAHSSTGAAPPRWESFFEHRRIGNRLMKARMACAHHDTQTFSKIENRRIDPQNPEHCLLLAYRAVLLQLHGKRVAARTFETLAPLDRLYALQHLYLTEAVREVERAKVQMDQQVFQSKASGTTSHMDHKYFSIKSEPRVAASAVIMRGGLQVAFTPRELEAVRKMGIPRSAYAEPIIVTVYPEPSEHIAIVSFPKGLESLARIVVPAIDEEKAGQAPALLSKTLLEESENIAVSPTAWKSFGKAKRRRIFQQYINTIPRPVTASMPAGATPSESLATEIAHSYEPEFIDNCDPEEVNLFSQR